MKFRFYVYVGVDKIFVLIQQVIPYFLDLLHDPI